MSGKRPHDDGGDGDARKKAKTGFKVGPDNLPDGPWRRKAIKIKHSIIEKAKVKKQYAKVKAQHQQQQQQPAGDNEDDQPAQIHPDRMAMLDDTGAGEAEAEEAPPVTKAKRQRQRKANPTVSGENMTELAPRVPRPRSPTPPPPPAPVQGQESEGEGEGGDNRNQFRNRSHQQRRPGYFDKELSAAEKLKQQTEERAQEMARREEEKNRRIAEREKYRKAMAKARTPGRDGKRKVGREGNLLLDKVKRIMGESK